MDGFYAARSRTIPPLPWTNFAPPFSGEGLVAFRSSPEALRSHCGTCGCPLTFTFDADPDHTWITIGSFDNPSLIAPAENWFVQDKVDWVMIDPALRNFPGGPPT